MVVDTNIFVAAQFQPESHAGKIVAHIRDGIWTMVWNDATRRETRAVIQRIPPLDWDRTADLFHTQWRFDGPTDPEYFDIIEDPTDRKFAALAAAADATLVSNDDHLLRWRAEMGLKILTSGELVRERLEDHSE